MSVTIRSERVRSWLGAADPFEKIKAIKGLVVRSKEGRTTQRFEIDNQGFYVKLHEGIGWKEVIKNLLQLRLPVTGASNEWLAINRFHDLGLDTLNAVAFGKKGFNPASQTSFVMTEELTQTISLAKYAERWPEQPPAFLHKKALIEKVAEISRIMHSNGINHRDLYICHFLLDIASGQQAQQAEAIRLFVVDLHRAQIRSQVPRRWLVKDVGSIYFSALDIGLTKGDVYRFLRGYYQMPLRDIFNNNGDFLSAVERRAVNLYRRDFKRTPVLIK
ncbi:lipopolysaccharide core heptose(I) kinase RfaP [Oceanicoccus sagamiensis]|uniref:Lipopolysaccharide core heptose(I) kinase n=1 Tax=Oceanicoccus sagamiensis TaxID=716816 RepID=A0A1X9N9Z0_9GAMM|nr:lipopolysaccharide core heptose(I) kinase RfaP [Oceanicoccus sagamiensis]ARN73894.1 lipopolysaccharide core heptose(I) kinase RfaP [Oceanicoccus sagamiensis]